MALEYSIRDQIATVVLNRPEAMNSIDPETEGELLDCWQRIRADDDIRVVILTGAGERAFCTGSDLKKTMPPPGSYASRAFGKGDVDIASQLAIEKPVICAINGYALGGGLEIALACDIRIAAEHARFGLPEVKVGSIPGAGGTQRLPRTVSASDAMLLLLTGDHVDAAEALRLGIVSRVVPFAELRREAEAIAGRIAGNAPLSVRAVKRLVKQGQSMPLDVAIAQERLTWGALRGTEDYVEGRRAFQEKRKPVYRGQ